MRLFLSTKSSSCVTGIDITFKNYDIEWCARLYEWSSQCRVNTYEHNIIIWIFTTLYQWIFEEEASLEIVAAWGTGLLKINDITKDQWNIFRQFLNNFLKDFSVATCCESFLKNSVDYILSKNRIKTPTAKPPYWTVSKIDCWFSFWY